MPNIKSAKKELRKTRKRTKRNKLVKKNIKDLAKNFIRAVGKEDKAAGEDFAKKAIKAIDRAASKGVLKKNTAGRKKSRIMKRLNALTAASK